MFVVAARAPPLVVVMLQVLREDHEARWSRAELEREIYDIAPLEISDTLERLRREGLVHVEGELVLAVRAARHLEDLGMFSI